MSEARAEPGHGEDRVTAWEGELHRLERDVSLAEELLAHPPADLDEVVAGLGTWRAPDLDGPLPAVLLGRARDLERRQSAVRAGLGRALAGTRAGIERARRTAFADPPTAPAYVDVSA